MDTYQLALNEAQKLENKAQFIREQAQAQKQESAKADKSMKNWLGYQFESSSMKTPEFMSFARSFRSYIKRVIPQGYELVRFEIGHFEVYGHIKSPQGKYVYFSISDVRYFPDSWYNDILVRTAKDIKDYSGGQNHSTSLDNFSMWVFTLANQ